MFQKAVTTVSNSVLSPIVSLQKRYIPLLLIYFAYGFQSVTSVTLTFWEKDNLTLSAEQLVSLGVWVSLPWTLKMIVGQLVDNVSLFGSRRKAYIVLGALLMALGYIVLMGLMMKAPWVEWIGDEYMVYLVASLLSVFGFMIQDVTADTMTTEVVDRTKKKDSVIKKELAMVQILGRLSLMIGGVLAAGLTGYLATMFAENPHNVIWVALLIPFISVLGVGFIKLNETKEKSKGLDVPIFFGGIGYAVFLLFMAFIGPLTELVSSGVFVPFLAFISSYAQEFTLLVSFVLLSVLLFRITRNEPKQRVREILLVLGAIFVFRMTPSTGPGFSWWAIDELGFDQAFFGVLRLIGSLIPLILLWFIADFIASKPVKNVLLWLIVIGTILNLPEVSLYYGVHEILGVSPRLVTVADTVFDSPLIHISMIPMLAMIAYYAPAHARGTWFALAASFMNLALTAGSLFTKYLNQVFVVSREVLDEAGNVLVAADYSQLGSLLIAKISISLVVPLIAVLLLLPKKKISS